MSQSTEKPLLNFDEALPTRVVFGDDVVDRIGALVGTWAPAHALIVTDKHIVAAGHAARVAKSLEATGVRVTIYDDVCENPTTDDVESCLDAARDIGIDTIIGLGGGSSMDTAKGCNFVLTNGSPMHQYHGIGKATKPMLPLVAIPTTGGTGSECQSFALIADAKTHVKMACGDPKAAPRVAILDPTLTLTQPRKVTANTGIDALTHAMETAVTMKRNETSLRFSREAFRLIVGNLGRVLEAPDDLAARGQMLLGAAYAGTAIQNSMLGAVHATANPLTSNFGIVHGQAVGVMLPAVIRFNAEDEVARSLYHELAVHAELTRAEDGAEDSVDAIIECVSDLIEAAGLKADLGSLGIGEESIAKLASEAAKQWTGNFNPREVDEELLAGIYRGVMGE